jgi:hypothetical protein
MKITIIGGLLVAALAIASAAQAQSRTPGINRTQHRQERRITRDVRHDRITRMQAYHLRRDEMRLDRQRRFAMADHRVNPMERRHLRREERRINHAIRRDERMDRVS